MADKLIKFTSWNVNGMGPQDTGLSKAKTFRCNNKNKEGRILVLLVHLSCQMVISGNLYAPNEEDSDFFFNLKKILLDFGDFQFILGGDFNQPPNLV